MLSLLQPIWMFVAAGITIPVAIHLWNVRQGKILRIGSVSLLTEQAMKNSSNIKLHELLLLLLRCLLILLLAVLLSKPQWLPAKGTGEKGWVLIPKSTFNKTYNYFKPQVDSLLQAGYALHYFGAGFEEKNMADALKEQPDNDSAKMFDYWKTISQLNNRVDTSLPLYIFTGNKLAYFGGNRPGTSLNLHWMTYGEGDSLQQYLSGAYKTYDDSIRIITANSKPTGTFNSYNNVAEAGISAAGYTLQPTSNGVKLKHGNDSIIVSDTAVLNITIYTGNYPNDAGYVKAAIEAIRQFSKRNIHLNTTDNVTNIPKVRDWVFWLSDKPIPENISAKNIVQYETGKENDIQTWVTPFDDYSFAGNQTSVYKSVTSRQDSTGRQNILWKDGFGNAVLSVERGKTNVFHFYSHFNPSWNGLPWGDDFAQMILGVLLKEQSNPVSGDNRMIDVKQLQPYTVAEKEKGKQLTKQSVDLTTAIWLAAAIIFLMERIMANRHKKERLNAT